MRVIILAVGGIIQTRKMKRKGSTLEGCNVVDGAVEAADGVSAEALGAASERAKSAVHIGVRRHLAEALLRLWRRRRTVHARIGGGGSAAAGAEEAGEAGQPHSIHQATSKVLVQSMTQYKVHKKKVIVYI
jgi:hypothetical protein